MACFAAFSFSMVISILTGPLAIVIVVSVCCWIGDGGLVRLHIRSEGDAELAKDQLKAHLLAVRPVSRSDSGGDGSYGKILRGTGSIT